MSIFMSHPIMHVVGLGNKCECILVDKARYNFLVWCLRLKD